MKYIFIFYTFDIMKVNIFMYIVDQTLLNLILTKPNMHSKLGWREYYVSLPRNILIPNKQNETMHRRTESHAHKQNRSKQHAWSVLSCRSVSDTPGDPNPRHVVTQGYYQTFRVLSFSSNMQNKNDRLVSPSLEW
jgi:hypothetical protein